MAELDEKLVDELLKSSTEKIPGLGYVVAILTVLLGLLSVVPREAAEFRGIIVSLVAVGVSIGAYRLGSILDKWLFDPVFAPDAAELPPLRRRIWMATRRIRDGAIALNVSRHSAAKRLHLPVQGIYSESALMFERSHAWEAHVKLPLELSKAARTFILPLMGLTVYELAGSPRGVIAEHVRPAFLASPIFPAIILISLASVYVQLRILHMEALYKLVLDAKEQPAQSLFDGRLFLLAERLSNQKPVTYRFYFGREQRRGSESRIADGRPQQERTRTAIPENHRGA